MTDIGLIKATLKVLDRLNGRSLTEESLGCEVEIQHDRPLTTTAVSDAVRFCQQQGWVACRQDQFARSCWHLTDAGQNQLAEM